MKNSENSKLKTENEQLRAELLKVTTKLDCSLENNIALSAQMKDLQEKLDIIIEQFRKQNKKQYGSKNEHHNPRQAPANIDESAANDAKSNQPEDNGGVATAAVKKPSRLK